MTEVIEVGLQQRQPEIAQPRQREAPGLGQTDAPQHLDAGQAEGEAGLDLARGNRQKGRPKNFGRIGAIDESQHDRAGNEGVDIHPPVAAGKRHQRLQQRGAAVIDQKHEDEFGDPAHDHRIRGAEQPQPAPWRKLRQRAGDAQGERHEQGGDAGGDGDFRAVDQKMAVALKIEKVERIHAFWVGLAWMG